ncbi:MAG: hypothetical protein Q9214_001403, partial [Letrouitia sp. 1 TL-2023]
MDTTSPHPSSEIAFVSRAVGDTLQDLPKLTYGEPNSPPEVDEWYLINNVNSRDTIQNKKCHDELEWFEDMSEVDLDESKLPNANTIFSTQSRPQTPLCSVAQPSGDDNSNNENNDDD